MAEIKLPYRGLERGTVPVPRSQDGTAIVVEIKGFLLLGFRSADACPEFAGTVGGRHDDVFRFLGPAATCRMTVSDHKGYVALDHYSLDGTRKEPLVDVRGPYRGQFKLPGPGLIQTTCFSGWSATVET